MTKEARCYTSPVIDYEDGITAVTQNEMLDRVRIDIFATDQDTEAVFKTLYSNKVVRSCLKQTVSYVYSSRKRYTKDFLIISYGIRMLASRYHDVSTEDVNFGSLEAITAKKTFLFIFPERERVTYSWWRTQNVFAQVSDTY